MVKSTICGNIKSLIFVGYEHLCIYTQIIYKFCLFVNYFCQIIFDK